MAPENETDETHTTAFRDVPKTGVIYVMSEAAKAGYTGGDAEWTNLGQGQPEAGALPGASQRIAEVTISEPDLEYAPVAGIWELREAVAAHYNRLYRRGKRSQYTAENVCISSGGRTALTRAAAALGNVHLGHFLPDYTAYEELLGLFRLFQPIPILLDPQRGYDFSLKELETEILGKGLGAILLSNPCNPTGKLIAEETLSGWVSLMRRHACTMLVDEFYSHYIWESTSHESYPTVSAAAFVEDVDRDPVVVFDGLTKNWRYPGWRVAWTLGPKHVIERLSAAGSFLDGGCSRPLQRAAIPLLEPELHQAEVAAIQKRFRAKRDMMLTRLRAMGVQVDAVPEGTFYIWGNVRNLPTPIDSGIKLFRRALEEKVICVPGHFFDVDPGQRRMGRESRFKHHVRFSFGPEEAGLSRGLDRLETLIKSLS